MPYKALSVANGLVPCKTVSVAEGFDPHGQELIHILLETLK